MVDILVGAIPPVQNNQSKRDNQRRSVPQKKVTKEKRKNRADRRKAERSGVVVTLSKYPNFRKGADRRKHYPHGG